MRIYNQGGAERGFVHFAKSRDLQQRTESYSSVQLY